MKNSYADDFNRINRTYIRTLSDKRYKSLCQDTEMILIKNAKNGDIKSQDKLIESHLRMVVSIAKRYRGKGVSLSDLIQEGNLAMFEALKRFDENKNIRFGVYAKWWVEKYIKMALDSNKVINENELTIIENNSNDNENTKKENEVYYNTQLKEESVESSVEDLVEREKNYTKIVQDLLETLDKRTKEVIEYCYGLNGKEILTLVEISKIMNISSERARQLKMKGMLLLRSKAIAKSLSIENFVF